MEERRAPLCRMGSIPTRLNLPRLAVLIHAMPPSSKPLNLAYAEHK